MSWCGGGEISPTPGVACRVFGDPRPHLVAGQLATLAGLGALRHLDLQVVGVDEVFGGDAEPAARDLLDRGPARRVVEPLDVFAALAGVGLAAQPVHRDREGLVRLRRDRAVGHRAGGEPPDDRADRLDLVERHRRPVAGAQPEQPAQRAGLGGQLVHRGRVAGEDVLPPAAGGVLEQEHRLGVEQVQLALAAPLVFAADVEPAVAALGLVGRVRAGVPGGDLGVDVGQPGTADLRRACRRSSAGPPGRPARRPRRPGRRSTRRRWRCPSWT